MTLLYRQTAAGLRMIVLFTVVLGVVYPLAIWAVAHLPGLADRAEGSVLRVNGSAVGSSLIGVDPVAANPGADPYFHSRPSALAKDVLGPGDPSTSGASNKGAFNQDLVTAISQRKDQIAAREGVAPNQVPPDAVTASGSGLDPDISPAYVALQAARVARVTGLPVDRVRQLVSQYTDGRVLAIFGEPGVNITELNVAISQAR
ncbi:MAG TPA: K(+)-transporting ATPase subunit C [Pseudonocardia sp.]|nr:K(+)-transporting ATPase subunit C [Pseudonocardia sp.]